jgi:hypothetical protein
MRKLVTLLLPCLSACVLGQTTGVLSPFANPLPKGKVVADGNNFAVVNAAGMTNVYFNGTAITGDALNWGTPAQFADRLLNEGANLVRFHHEAATVARLVSLADACYSRGIYFCFDVVGDRWMNRKVEVYEAGPVRAELVTEMDRLKPLLKHAGLAYVGLVNEGATPLKGKYNSNFAKVVQMCDSTYLWFKSRLRERGYTGLVGDLPDANIDGRFAPIIAKQDMILVHGYGTHNNGQNYRPENWARNGVHLGSMIHHIQQSRLREVLVRSHNSNIAAQGLMAPSPKPALIQEFACMYPAPDRAMNEINWRTELLRRGVSVVSYGDATNQSQLRGTHTEVHDFAKVTDPARQIAALAGALLIKYGRGKQTDWYWGHMTGKTDPNYRYATADVSVNLDINRGVVKIKTPARKMFVILLDKIKVQGFTSVDIGNGWWKTTNRGGLNFIHLPASPMNLGVPVKTATWVNPFTLKKEAALATLGTGFSPDRALGIYEIDLN